MAVNDVFSFNNPAYNSFVFYSSVLGLKMLLMSVLTARQRFSKKAFINPEDTAAYKIKTKVDDDVERVRRAHMNDLENITVFMFVCSLYLLTNPAPKTAVMLMRAFTLSRFIHTLVYAVVVVPQPARAVSWFVGYGITIFMAGKTAMNFIGFM